MDDEKDVITLARQHTPEVVRTLARIARKEDSASVENDAISILHAYHLLDTRDPSDDDLRLIESMTDDEILDALRHILH